MLEISATFGKFVGVVMRPPVTIEDTSGFIPDMRALAERNAVAGSRTVVCTDKRSMTEPITADVFDSLAWLMRRDNALHLVNVMLLDRPGSPFAVQIELLIGAGESRFRFLSFTEQDALGALRPWLDDAELEHAAAFFKRNRPVLARAGDL